MTESLVKYQHGSIIPTSLTEQHDMSTTCGQPPGWLEGDKVATAIG
jgi:hypothetical protein